MNNCLLIKGLSRYEVLRDFIGDLALALRSIGYSPIIHDTANSTLEQLSKLLTTEIKFIISYNGAGSDIIIENQSIYDILNIPFVSIFVDHPIYFYKRLQEKVNNQIYTFVDKAHTDYMNRFHNDKTVAFLPHIASISPTTPLPMKDRDIDILFCGSYDTPNTLYKETIDQLNKSTADFLEEIIEQCVSNEYVDFYNATISVFDKINLRLNNRNLLRWQPILQLIDKTVRMKRRGAVINKILESGQNIHCYGDGWDKLKTNHPENLIMHKNLPYKKMLEMMTHSKIVLNILPGFTNGSHERVFSSMANGAVCVSDENIYLKEQFIDGKEIVFYTHKNLDDLPYKISNILQRNDLLEQISEAGYKKTIENHTWINCSKQLVQMIDLLKLT